MPLPTATDRRAVPPARADVDDVATLCRLAVAARHVGCRIHLGGATPELWTLIALAGVDDVLVPCPVRPRPAEGDLP